MKQLIAEELVNFSTPEGMISLGKLVKGANKDGYFETLTLLLERIKIDINHADSVRGWTILHEVFSMNQSFEHFYDKTIDDKDIADSRHIKAIDLLIYYGAKPLKDRIGQTPLMCLTNNKLSQSFNRSVIDRYYKSEADYYRIDPEKYKSELIKLSCPEFNTVKKKGSSLFRITVPRKNAIKSFWDNIAAASLKEDRTASM